MDPIILSGEQLTLFKKMLAKAGVQAPPGTIVNVQVSGSQPVPVQVP